MIKLAVDHPDQIREIFDAISYAKGASVIRMLAAHLGVENFMRGDKKQMVRRKTART
ncbi:unnamed protein product [Ascophyllum nodosum]